MIWEHEAPCARFYQSPDKRFERQILRPPQRTEGRDFESFASESEGSRALGAGSEKVCGNVCSQFVNSKNAHRHGGGSGISGVWGFGATWLGNIAT